MKKLQLTVIATLACLLIGTFAFAQAPNAIPYQGVARNAAGNILASQPISLRINIHDITAVGTVVYSETHGVTTTTLGLFNVNIGQGTPVTGTLAGVNWGSGAKFIQVEMDAAGSINYADMGTTQLNSVPYALYAGSSANLPNGTANGNTMRWNGTAWVADNALFNNGSNVGIGTTTPAAKLDVAGTVKIVDGSQGAGKVLKSDANGLASWNTLSANDLLSTPISPNSSCLSVSGSVSTNSRPHYVAVSGNFAYVVNLQSGTMQVVDISNAATPTVVGSLSGLRYPVSIAVSGNYAYVTDLLFGELKIINISNPASPVLVSSLQIGSGNRCISVKNNYAYVVDQDFNSLYVINITNPASPSVTSSVTTGSTPVSIFVSGNYAYVANYSGTMQVIDISNPNTPVVVGTVAVGTAPAAVSVSGNYAYVVNQGSNSMMVINVSNPANPTVAGTVATNNGPASISLTGNYAYVVNNTGNSLQVINISNPASPIITSSVTTGAGPMCVKTSGNFAYVVNDAPTNNLQVINLVCPNYAVTIDPATGQTTAIAQQWNTTGNDINNTNPGNVGVGTTAPNQKLDVNGVINSATGFKIANGAATTGTYLRGNGTNFVASGIQVSDMPTLNQNTTGTAANVTGVVAVANGGTGSSGPATAGTLLRGDGIKFVASTIQASDVPTLNQNTTGTASNVTDIVAIANGGTGSSTQNFIDLTTAQTAAGVKTWSNDAIFNGNVGIGINAPVTKLEVNQPYNASLTTMQQSLSAHAINISSDYLHQTYKPGLVWSNKSFFVDKIVAGIWPYVENTGSKLLFGTTNNLNTGITNTAMAIDKDGNVGIGTTAPANKLDVEGGLAVGATYSGTNAAPTNGAIIEGNVGIGTTSPANKLDVEGGLAVGATYSGTNAAPTNGAIIQGNVGIGTTAPANKLDVEGGLAVGATYSGTNAAPANGAIIQGNVGIGTSSPDAKLTIGTPGTTWTDFGITSDSRIGVVDGSGNRASVFMKSYGTYGALEAFNYGTPFGYLPISLSPNGGNVGIGTTTPANKLDVEGGLAVGATYSGTNAAPANGAIIEGNVGIGTTVPGDKLSVRNGAISFHAPSNDVPYVGMDYDATSDALRIRANVSATALNTTYVTVLRTSGNMGIGTNTPANKLDIEGGLAVGATYSGTNAAPANGAIIQGNVGIGINNPGHKLDVHASSGATIGVGDLLGTNPLLYMSGGTSTCDFMSRNNHDITFTTFSSGPAERMRITAAGRVGIGTPIPGVPLDVNGTSTIGNQNYTNYMIADIQQLFNSPGISIRASGLIQAPSFMAISDARIKQKIGVSNSFKDLELLNKIKITDYNYIDKLKYGSGIAKKVIAQEVEEVYPQAVSKSSNFIPDVYALATSVIKKENKLSITLARAHGLKTGDLLKWIDEKGAEQSSTVTNVISGYSFEINTSVSSSKVFVYGKQVNDFRAVDYEALSTLNISATQELYKIITDLKSENENQKAAYEARLKALEEKLNTLLGTISSNK